MDYCWSCPVVCLLSKYYKVKGEEMKNILILSIFVLILNGCGGSSDNQSYGVTSANGIHYTCPSSEASDACVGGDCSSCNITDPVTNNEVIENDNTSNTCNTNGTTVTTKEGTTCIDNGNTLECKNGQVTYNGSVTASILNIGGITYKCELK